MARYLEDMSQASMIDPVDVSIISETLKKPPFVEILGSFNAHRIPLPHHAIYRTRSLETVTADDISCIQVLNITNMFDLRSLNERTSFPFPQISNVDTSWLPSTIDTPSPNRINNNPNRENPNAHFITTYLSISKTHVTPIKEILTHILASPPLPALSFNCTPGKDRAGIVAHILLRLAGVPLQAIDLDCALTRVGIEPVRKILTQKLARGKTARYG